jgi:prophage regulatory protein
MEIVMTKQQDMIPAPLLRLKQIVAPQGPLPISKSTFWAGVRSGRYPQPVKLGPRITAWRAADIVSLIEALDSSTFSNGKK